MRAKLRHIAFLVSDPEAAARFFEAAFALERVGAAPAGIYLSDGTMNIALLKSETKEDKPGLWHFGMWVDDLEAAQRAATNAGAVYMSGALPSDNSFYECKYRGPEGLLFDLTAHGWIGAAKDVVPVVAAPAVPRIEGVP